jgi:hypothetical protein
VRAPGVGRYAAAATLGAPAVDGTSARVYRRYFGQLDAEQHKTVDEELWGVPIREARHLRHRGTRRSPCDAESWPCVCRRSRLREGKLPGTSLPDHRFVVRLDPEQSRWFEEPVDMDDVLTAGGSGMYALRTMEDRSFAVFDEAEHRAFEQELRLGTSTMATGQEAHRRLAIRYPSCR